MLQRFNVLERSSHQYGEFKALVAQETDWLDKLEKRLRKSPEGAADAEDITEELDVSIFKQPIRKGQEILKIHPQLKIWVENQSSNSY